MSFYEDLKRKVDEEKAYKKANVLDNESKIVSVRPDPMIMSLIEIFSFINKKSPADYIATHFSKELAIYVSQRKDTIKSLEEILKNGEINNLYETDDNALGILLKNELIDYDLNLDLEFK